MRGILCLVLTFIIHATFGLDDFLAKFVQADYKVKDIRMEVEYYNKSMLNTHRVVNYKPNRTTTAFNFSVNFKVDVQDKIEVTVQAYKFASNEFRDFPLRFQTNMCKAFNANIAGFSAAAVKCGNISKCYFYKDINYSLCNFIADFRRLPPYIPNGLYKFQLFSTFENYQFSIMNWYGEIYRPFDLSRKGRRF